MKPHISYSYGVWWCQHIPPVGWPGSGKLPLIAYVNWCLANGLKLPERKQKGNFGEFADGTCL